MAERSSNRMVSERLTLVWRGACGAREIGRALEWSAGLLLQFPEAGGGVGLGEFERSVLAQLRVAEGFHLVAEGVGQ
jgi:hypothetical protein